MLFKTYLVPFALILVAGSTLAPLISIEQFTQKQAFNLYQLDLRVFLLTWAIIALSALTYFAGYRAKFYLLRFVWSFWMLFLALAFFLKASSAYTFNFADPIAAGSAIQYQWGWVLAAIGGVLLFLSRKPTA